MSRSIHSTYRDYQREERYLYADDAVREERLEKIRERMERKRSIKDQVRRERKHPPPTDPPPVDPATIPIEVLDQGRVIHYPASVQDLRCIMERLPAGALTGVSSVRLCLGALQQEEYLDDDDRTYLDLDPWLGRPGHELIPGVFTGCLLGQYFHEGGRIEICAYVYDPELPHRARWELFLRLKALSTFVHEVAHHEDRMRRLARGKWRMDDEEKNEDFAETIQAQWTREIVVPYLEETYPEEVGDLNRWMQEHGGAIVPLDTLAGNWRWEMDAKPVCLAINSALEAFCYLADDVGKDLDPAETKLNFACFLHYGAYYDLAHTALASILKEQPDHLGALALKADILEHEERFDEAESLARAVLDQDDTCLEAWETLGLVYFGTKNWQALINATTRGMGCTDGTDWHYTSLLERRARAHLELGHVPEAEADLDEVYHKGKWGPRAAAPLQAVIALRAGEYEEVLKIDLPHTKAWMHRPELVAARFEAAQRLGRPDEAGELTPDHLDCLRGLHFGEWADRLAATYGKSMIGRCQPVGSRNSADL